MNLPFLCFTLFCLTIFRPSILHSQVLYQTDFSEFPAGADQWAGSGGWEGNPIGEGVHGIDDGEIEIQGQSAFIGFEKPSVTSVSLYRVIDSSAWELDVLRFEALIGVSSSLTGGDDLFAIAFHDESGGFLASLQFNLDPLEFGLWRDDGVESIDTGEVFFLDYLHLVEMRINLRDNTWTVSFDGIGVFEDERFTQAVADSRIQFGGLGVEWEILDAANPGDNWLFLDDLELSVAEGKPVLPFEVESMDFTDSGGLRLTWMAPLSGSYLLEQSDDGQEWRTHSGGQLTVAEPGLQLFESAEPALAPRQLLRLRRLEVGS